MANALTYSIKMSLKRTGNLLAGILKY